MTLHIDLVTFTMIKATIPISAMPDILLVEVNNIFRFLKKFSNATSFFP